MFVSSVDRARDVVAKSIRNFFATNSLSIYIHAAVYQKMMEDSIMSVVRQFSQKNRTVPFVVVSGTTGGENLVGFGKSRIAVDGVVSVESSVGPFNLGNERWFIEIAAGDEIHVLDVYGFLFPSPASVSAEEIVTVIWHQVPRGFWIEAVDDRLRISGRVKELNVISTSPHLGFTTGVRVPAEHRLVTGTSEMVTYSIDVGAESEIVRTQIMDALMLWVYWLRTSHVGFEEASHLSLSGPVRRGTDSEQSFGTGDLFLHLYMNRIEVPTVLYSYENSSLLLPVTGVNQIREIGG